MENKTNAANSSQQANSENNALNMDNLTGMLKNMQLPENLKQCSDWALKKVNNMSTTQKVIGGALLLIGAGYLTRRSRLNLGNLGNLVNKVGKMRR